MRNKLGFAALCLVLCSSTAFAETVDRVVAVVNGEAITRSDLDHAMAVRLPQIVRSASREAAFYSVRRQALERLIDEKLLHQAMKKSKLEVEPEETERALEGWLRQRKLTRQQLQSALQQQRIPMETFLKHVEDEVRQMKFVQQEVGRRVRITEQEMEDYYRRHKGEFKSSGRVRVGQIILAFAPAMDAKQRANLQKKAQEIARQARQGDFAALAKAHSEGPKAAEGGDLGIVDPTTLHPEVAGTLARMQVGEVSDPILSKVGYHIIKLIDRGSTADTDFERLKDEIQQALYQQKMEGAIAQYVSQLRQRAYVEIKE